MTTPREERPIELGEVPSEEGISTADASERLDEAPADQVNYTDQTPDQTPDSGA